MIIYQLLLWINCTPANFLFLLADTVLCFHPKLANICGICRKTTSFRSVGKAFWRRSHNAALRSTPFSAGSKLLWSQCLNRPLTWKQKNICKIIKESIRQTSNDWARAAAMGIKDFCHWNYMSLKQQWMLLVKYNDTSKSRRGSDTATNTLDFYLELCNCFYIPSSNDLFYDQLK